MPTIFEQIIAGDIPAHKVYEDDTTFAFLDAEPINPGHTLVIPKAPYETIFDIPEDLFADVMQTVHLLAPKIKKAVDADGINIGNNNGAAAGQEVPHYHVHIMPRFEDDTFSHWQGKENYHAGERGGSVAENIIKEII